MSTPLLDQITRRTENTGVVRYRDGRMIGGVARGVAARFDVDPVVVRVGFVIALFAGGLGVALYLLGWVLLPDDRGDIALRRAFHDHDVAAWALLISAGLATLAAAVSLVAGRDSGRFLGVVALVGIVWYVARRNHSSCAGERAGTSQAGTSQAATAPTPAAPATGHNAGAPASDGAPKPTTAPGPIPGVQSATPGTMPVITPWSGRDGERAVAYGAAAHLGAYAATPQPTRVVAAPVVSQRRPRRRSLGFRLWLVAFALALVTWTAGHAIALATGHDALTANLVATGATTIALGLLVLAVGVRGYRTSGLVVPTLLLALVAASGQTALSVVGPDTVMGQVDWQPQSAADLRNDYSVGMGEGRLDLTRVSAADLAGRTIAAKAGMGELRVKIPDDIRVEIVPRVRLGEITIHDGGTIRTVDGFDAGRDASVVVGSGERTLRLETSAGLGEVRVERVKR